MDFSNYDKNSFEAMSIHALRVIGRNLGVDAPTMKSKSDLIESIIKIIEKNGGVINPAEQKPAKASKGRPPKKHFELAFSDSLTEPVFAPVDTAKPAAEEKPAEVKVSETNGTDANTAFSSDRQNSEKRRGRPPLSNGQDFFKRVNSGGSGNSGGHYGNNYNNNNNNYNNSNNYNNNNNYMRKKRDFAGDGVRENEDENSEPAALEIREGILEIMSDGYGFLRAKNYESGSSDAYVSAQKIKRYGLKKGDKVKAEARQTCENRPAGAVNILEVNGGAPEAAYRRKNFDTLTPIYPDVRYKLEIANKSNDFAIRSIDMVAPIGKGQRAMIVSPPKAGKTTLLKKVAHSISVNYPEAHLIVLLIDERPEEVTDMQRSIDGEVVFSTFDEMPEHHTKAAELVLERAKRLVELGKDVVILMDSLTRLARAYNLTISPTGRTLSGGIDPGALHSPKRFFGAARNIEHGGSLTIIATALVDTGSRMDDVIYEEFKGTGNMEIHLDRRLSEKRIFPAIDLYRSGTRREELLLDQSELQGIWAMRRMLSAGEGADATENLINMLVKTKTNKEFIDQLNLQIMSMQKQGFTI